LNKRDVVAMVITLAVVLPLEGCIVAPVYGPGYGAVVVDPFPFVWVGPGYYGGRYYYGHPGYYGGRSHYGERR
jgi:hypothetical protein